MAPESLLLQGDCVELMALMDDDSMDAIVTDPPYGLEFMGKDWDKLSGTPGYNERGRMTPASSGLVTKKGFDRIPNSFQAGRPMQDWHESWAIEALRVLKPGGHALVFGGTRTFHRLTCGLEDAGFEIRDCLMWLYGTGFPKSKNLDGDWEGWGTALKPAWEPIVLARKPFPGTVAHNVSAHGTGALNVDASRIATDDNLNGGAYADASIGRGEGVWRGSRKSDTNSMKNAGAGEFEQPPGRWPANLILDEEAAAMLDEQTSGLKGGIAVNHNRQNGSHSGNTIYGERNVDPTGDHGFGRIVGVPSLFLLRQGLTLGAGSGARRQ